MAGYLGASPVPQTIQKKQSFTATASQTTFTTTGYTDGQFINVYLNGVRLINGTDYTATNGSDIVLTTGASASDVLDFETFNEFTLVDQTLETPTFRTSATLKNDTEEDTDGGRESTLIFKGEQSGGEISTLAEIEASHDGTADDEKGDLIFRTNDGSDGSSPTEAMRIDSGQNILIGKSDAETTISGSTPSVQITGAGVDSSLAVTRREANQYGPTLFLSKSRNTTPNNYTIVQNNDSLGTIAFIGDDGTNLDTYGATISAEVDGTAGANDLPTRLKFSVTHDGASTPTEKIRIDEDGLKFNGDTAEANALDDYEEGTWTPVLKATTTDPTVGGYHSNTGGRYTKIGNRVYVNFFMQTTSISSNGSGTLQIGGLPYTNIVLPGASEGSGMFVNYYVNTNLAAGKVLHGYVRNGQTNMLLSVNGNGDDTAAYAAGTPAGDFGLYAMAVYHID